MGESEPEVELEWIPRQMREALDRVGIKLHLRQWQALPLAARQHLAQLAEAADADPFAATLRRLLLQYLGSEPERLTRNPEPKGHPMAFVVTNRIPVAAGHEADFEDRFRKRAHLIDSSPGFIKNLVLRPVLRRFDHASGQWVDSTEQGYYLVQTYWESETDFWNWTRSESFRVAHSNRPPAEMFAGANVLEIHEVIQTTEKKES